MSSRLASALAAASGLLPQRTGDFGSQKYWETFFERRAGDSFEWYGSWIEFKSNLERAWGARPRDTSRTLVIGCGNSELSQQLYKAGWSTQINVDFDAGVIREMQQKTGQGYPGMQFVEMDARNLSALGGARFDFIVDKGTLDAMCTSDSADVRESVQRMLREVAGVVSPGGVYAVITLLQRHVLRELLGMSWLDCPAGAARNGSAWASIRIEVFDDADGSSPLCPFVVVATAATAQPADPAASLRSHAAGFPVALRLPPLLGKLSGELPGSSEELNFNLRPRPLLSRLSEAAVSSVGESPDASALATVEDDVAAVLQGVVQAQIVYSTARQIASIAKGHRVELDVWMQAASAPAAAGAVQKRKGGKAVSDVDARASGAVFITLAGASAPAELCASSAAAPPRPRFSITAVDVSSTTRVGVLLVPQGREHEWSFGSAEGQAELAAQAGFGRLLFVCMGRGHSFPGGQAAVQAELSSIVPQLVPPALRASRDIPFLAVAEDIGARDIVAEGSSTLSSAWVVEDVPWNNDMEADDEVDNAQSVAASEKGGEVVCAAVTTPSSSASRKKKSKGKGKKNERDSDAVAAKPAAAVPPVAVRRLIFMSNRNAVQSAVRLLRGPGGSLQPDHSWLDFDYHKGMVAAVALQLLRRAGLAPAAAAALEGPFHVVIVGLGGGALPMFLASQLPQARVTVIELDDAVVGIAAKYFGLRMAGGAPLSIDSPKAILPASSFAPGEVRVVVGDGIDYFRRLSSVGTADDSSGIAADAVLIDTDAKDISSGLSFPPAVFLAPQFLSDVGAVLRPRRGCAVFNVAARSRTLFDAVVGSIRDGFKTDSDSERSVAATAEVICASIDQADLNCLVAVRPPSLPAAGTERSPVAGSAGMDSGLALPVRQCFQRWAALFDATSNV